MVVQINGYRDTATKVGKNRNLELFSQQVVDLMMPGMGDISFHTTEAVFDFNDQGILIMNVYEFLLNADSLEL